MDKQRMEEKAKAHAQEYCGHANEYHKTACELDFKVGYQAGYADAEQRVEVLTEALENMCLAASRVYGVRITTLEDPETMKIRDEVVTTPEIENLKHVLVATQAALKAVQNG